VVSSWHSLQQLQHLALIGLSVTAQDAPALTAFLAAGSAVTLTSLILGDQQGLSFLSDAALDGLGALLSSSSSCGSSSSSRGLLVLDLSGCIEITDAGERARRWVGVGGKGGEREAIGEGQEARGEGVGVGAYTHLTHSD
jgi:hypothetical protein